MENAGTKAVSGRSIAAVMDALAAHGIEIEADCIRIKPKVKRRS